MKATLERNLLAPPALSAKNHLSNQLLHLLPKETGIVK